MVRKKKLTAQDLLVQVKCFQKAQDHAPTVGFLASYHKVSMKYIEELVEELKDNGEQIDLNVAVRAGRGYYNLAKRDWEVEFYGQN